MNTLAYIKLNRATGEENTNLLQTLKGSTAVQFSCRNEAGDLVDLIDPGQVPGFLADAANAGNRLAVLAPVGDEQAAGHGKAVHFFQAETAAHAVDGFLGAVGFPAAFHDDLSRELQGIHAGRVRIAFHRRSPCFDDDRSIIARNKGNYSVKGE